MNKFVLAGGLGLILAGHSFAASTLKVFPAAVELRGQDDRMGVVVDPFGHGWMISTRTREMTHDIVVGLLAPTIHSRLRFAMYPPDLKKGESWL